MDLTEVLDNTLAYLLDSDEPVKIRVLAAINLSCLVLQVVLLLRNWENILFWVFFGVCLLSSYVLYIIGIEKHAHRRKMKEFLNE